MTAKKWNTAIRDLKKYGKKEEQVYLEYCFDVRDLIEHCTCLDLDEINSLSRSQLEQAVAAYCGDL